MGNFIGPTSSDKIRGKLVKYRLGDCLAIKSRRKYIGAIMTGKFNKYYNFTFMDFLLTTKPKIDDFLSGRLFGTRHGSWEELEYAVDQMMVECAYVDKEINIKMVGTLNLIPDLNRSGYAYLEDIHQMRKYYSDEIPVRIAKSKDAEMFPAIAFAGRHLIETKNITN